MLFGHPLCDADQTRCLWRVVAQHPHWSVPPLPDRFETADWDGTLVLYADQDPRGRSLYLMPLACRSENRRTKANEPLPGLTDGVTWDWPRPDAPERVRSILQKAYTQTETDPPPVATGRAPRTIESIVGLLRQRYGLDLPVPVQPAVRQGKDFDLHHLDEALRLSADSVPRENEVARILRLARALHELGEPLVCFTMDEVPAGLMRRLGADRLTEPMRRRARRAAGRPAASAARLPEWLGVLATTTPSSLC